MELLNLNKNKTCCGCLSTDRKMKIIDDFWSRACFSQIISEISALNSGLSLRLCWECTALLNRFKKFKYQVIQSYKILQEYSKSDPPFQINAQRLKIQKLISIEILPSSEDLSNKEEFTPFQVLQEEYPETEQNVEDSSIKEEDTFSNYEDDDDTALSELVSKKKNRQLNGSRRELKKRKKNSVNEETDVYTQVDLTETEVQEDRTAMCLREEYVNAMFRCERCIVSFPNADDLKDHVRLKHELNAANFKCPICECSFSTEVSYNYHKNRHTRRYQCVVCAERFASKRAVTKHYEMVHCRGNEFDMSHTEQSEKNEKVVEDSKQDPCFPCEFCPKTFRWKTSLRKHLETHRIETGQKRKPYCEPCKLTFTTTSNLQKHVKTSSKHQIQLKLRQLHASDATDVNSSDGSLAAREQQVRSAVNGARAQHPCPHCGARYQWRGNLLRHLHAHNARARGELVCQPCNRTFSSLATYQQHMKISKKHVSENDFKDNIIFEHYFNPWCASCQIKT